MPRGLPGAVLGALAVSHCHIHCQSFSVETLSATAFCSACTSASIQD
jgi:hypothetical protein